MMNSLAEMDPQWAWSPFEPTEERPFDLAAAAHLYRRAGFAANRRQLEQAVSNGPSEAVATLVSAEEPTGFRDEANGLAQAMLHTGQVGRLSAAWLYRIIATPHPLLEKMTLFWHGHFATSAAKVEDPKLMLDQNNLLRRHALGRFDELVQGISRDPGMLLYLDSATNRKSHPNENYARELLELFCLGEGHYSERDIRELARCFTGWQVKRNKFRFSRYQHDFGTKTIFGNRGAFGGEAAIERLLQQPAAAQFIARKLVRLFVCDEPAIPESLVTPLAADLRDNQYRVAPVVERILASHLFFSEQARARKIRSPVELACGLLRALEGSTDTVSLAERLAELGQALFYPPNVKGWDGGKSWINTSTLLGRANLVYELLHSNNTRFAGKEIDELLADYGVRGGQQLVAWLEELLLAVPLPPPVRLQLVELAGKGRGKQSRPISVIHAMSTLPEFQLG